MGLREVIMWLKLFNLIQEKTQQTVIGCQNGSRSKWVKMKNESAVKGLYNIYIYIEAFGTSENENDTF